MTINALNSLVSEERRTSLNFWVRFHDLIHILNEVLLLDIGDAEQLYFVGVYDQFDKYVLIARVDIFWDFEAAFRLDFAGKEILNIFLYQVDLLPVTGPLKTVAKLLFEVSPAFSGDVFQKLVHTWQFLWNRTLFTTGLLISFAGLFIDRGALRIRGLTANSVVLFQLTLAVNA